MLALKRNLIDDICKASIVLNHSISEFYYLTKSTNYMGMKNLYHKTIGKTGPKSSMRGISSKRTTDGLVKFSEIKLPPYSATVVDGHLLIDSTKLIFQEHGLTEFLHELQKCVKKST